MLESIDCTSYRRDTIILNGLSRKKMDSKYSLYFDESGNNRCFWIKDGKYNVDPFTHFVLGGIVSNRKIDFEYAKDKIGCNSTVQEIKTRNVCRGSFEDCLKNPKLSNYFDLLIEEGCLVHFSVVELFYYSIVDIVDSVTDNNDTDVLELKNELYNILRYNIDKTLYMMKQYDYPNIDDTDIKDFLLCIIGIVDEYITNTGKANGFTYKLRMLFQLAQNKEKLVFIQDEESGSLLQSFSHFYMRPIYMFKNSNIVFDEELEIQEKVDSCKMIVDGAVLNNYKFINSKSNVMIQLSDVFSGILARYFRFINANLYDVDEHIAKFDQVQLLTFNKLNHILNISFMENSAFWDMFLCTKMRCLFTYLVEKYSSQC
jgi:hypothetical protein